MKQLRVTNWHIHYRDFFTDGADIEITAYNELWFIVDDPPGLIVESDYGIYDSTDEDDPVERVHEHRGEILITNPFSEVRRRIKFIQVIMVN
jgi:hypothetical protein